MWYDKRTSRRSEILVRESVPTGRTQRRVAQQPIADTSPCATLLTGPSIWTTPACLTCRTPRKVGREAWDFPFQVARIDKTRMRFVSPGKNEVIGQRSNGICVRRLIRDVGLSHALCRDELYVFLLVLHCI